MSDTSQAAARQSAPRVARLTALTLATLLLGSPTLDAQDTAHADSASVAAEGHGRVELNIRHDRRAGDGDGGVRLSLDARFAARMGMAAGAATMAIVLGAGGLASRRRRSDRDAKV